MQRFELSTTDTLKAHLRAPLDSTVSYPKTLSISYLCLAHNPLEWWRTWSSQDGSPFLIVLRLVKTHILLPHTPIWENLFFVISSHGHYLQEDGKLQACDISMLIILNLHHTTLMAITTRRHPPWAWDHTIPHDTSLDLCVDQLALSLDQHIIFFS